MKPLKLLPLILIWVLGCASSAFAASVVDSSITNGSWSSPATWKNGRVPHDSDYVVVNTYVYLDQNVSLSYPGGGEIYITPNGSLCGPYTLDCELLNYGSFSCNVFIWEGNSYNYSTEIIVDYSENGSAISTFTNSPPGTICVGCPISCAIAPPEALFTSPASVCAGSEVTFTDESTGGPTNWLWLFPGGSPSTSTLQNPTITYYSSGTYKATLIVSNIYGTDTVYKTVYINPLPTACCDTAIAFGKSAQLKVVGAVSYSWAPPTGLSCTDCPDPTATPSVTTTYSVTMTSDSGCTVTDAITVDVICGDVFVPTAFSPNGDNENDILYVRGDCIKAMDFIIFDRWGNKLFESESESVGWNGIYQGQPMNTGTYVYYLTATLQDGNIIKKKGNVALLR
jgi:gliding motility-associated-like protein